ncbi:MAG TPA: NADP-dependent oxidoreductase [Candidatus Limnocylindrales bacterium]|jgi:NADPH:quinone reductase-like Zn-dependent oxidoreductase|nr:NADP-dependent oxidoreductase [Candidatus Limnocylindrales bacterium]
MSAIATTTATIKAVRIHSFGGPEVLRLEEVPRPEPNADELLVQVHAAGVNPVDWKIREGHLGKIPLPSIMGSDFTGVVEALGPGVTEFRVGEPVFGTASDESGSYAEFALAPVTHVTEKPPELDHFQAAALPVAGLTAWQTLFDAGGLRGGQKVLIHAAAGGVGSFAVQFARWKGAYIIGTGSGRHLDFIRQLGVDEVVDYRTRRFEEVVRDADLVLDTIGGETQQRSWNALKRGGVLVSIVQPPSEALAAARGARGVFLRCDLARRDQLAQIADLVVRGQVKVFIEAVLPLSEARKAQELSQSGHTQGKILLRI